MQREFADFELHKLHAREREREVGEGEAGGGSRPGVILWTVCNICLREFFGKYAYILNGGNGSRDGRGGGGWTVPALLHGCSFQALVSS